MNDTITLVSHTLCPYVQRAAIAMSEKNIDYSRVYIDLGDPPAWFERVSPLGKVPLLLVGDTAIFESAVILEYLEETTGNSLHPVDPLERARHRGWMEFGSSILGDIWQLYSAPGRDGMTEAANRIREKFARMEWELGEGPWFSGGGFSLVDCVFGPIFRYFDVFDSITDLGVMAELPRVTHWRQALAGRHSVINAVQTDYPQLLEAFLRTRGSYLSTLMEAAD